MTWRELRYHSKRWLFIEWRFHLFVGLVVPLASVIYASVINCAEMFSRSGSIMCLAGGFLSFRRYLRGAENPFLRDTGIADQPAFRYVDPTKAKMEAPATDSTALGWGICFIVVGTAIWGYGDLVIKWLHITTA